MHEEQKFALLVARIVDLLETGQSSDERQDAVQAVMDHVNQGGITLRILGDRLAVDGVPAATDVPFIQSFIRRLHEHGIAEIRFAYEAAAVDVVEVLAAVAQPPSALEADRAVNRLRRAETSSVTVLDRDAVLRWAERRKRGIPQGTAGLKPVAPMKPERVGKEVAEDFVPPISHVAPGGGFQADGAHLSLLAYTKRLKGRVDAPDFPKGLNDVVNGVIAAVRDQRITEAIETIIALTTNEQEEPSEEGRLRYGVALRRMLTTEVLQPMIVSLLDPLYARDVAQIMRRAGARGTELLLDVLISAQTFAERRALLNALQQIDAGTDLVVGMLRHHQWYVVRNAADLVGELGITEGVAELGEAAKHPDSRVRLSAAIALAKIASPTAIKHLGKCLHDGDPQIRLRVAQQLSGRELGALAMPLVNAAETEEDEDIRAELYKALGRIGTQDAILALVKAVKPAGLMAGRRVAKTRLAAARGLCLASGPKVVAALTQLSKDRDRHVKEVAAQGLQSIQSRESDLAVGA